MFFFITMRAKEIETEVGKIERVIPNIYILILFKTFFLLFPFSFNFNLIPFSLGFFHIFILH